MATIVGTWPRGMTLEVASAYSGVPKHVIRSKLPASAKIGRVAYWYREDIDVWLDGQASRERADAWDEAAK